MSVIYLLLLCFVASTTAHSKPLKVTAPVVTTPMGVLQGSVIKSHLGRDIFSFKGVRYAIPPIGALRFKSAVPSKPWKGIVNATKDGSDCRSNEDCLFLNVYTTQLPGAGKSPRSVFVWIHGGAWVTGSGDSKSWGPHYIMEQDIVLVTCNYRLGALGFLSTGDSVLPGNYGMKDQVAVLRWVNQNIASFGGNPYSVTIGGISAGGASVWFHLLSPLSRGLFHGVIAMSPSIHPEWSVNRDPMGQAKKQAKLMKCPTHSSAVIADCLRRKPAKDIINSYSGMTDWNGGPILIYTPVIEESGEESFLTSNPKDLLSSGTFHQVPYMAGITTEEFAPEAWRVLKNADLTKELNDKWEMIAPLTFMYEHGTEKSRNISRGLKEFYFQNQTITNASAIALGELYSDSCIIYGSGIAAQMISDRSSRPVFYYLSSYQAGYTRKRSSYGMNHGMDSIYLFYVDGNRFFIPDDPEYQVMVKYTTMWGNFIRTGNPSYNNEAQWLPLTTKDLNYLDISKNLTMRKEIFQDRVRVWDHLMGKSTKTGLEHVSTWQSFVSRLSIVEGSS